MIIFPGDYVKVKADGAWHSVQDTDGGMLLFLDNGFLTYAHQGYIDECLSAAEYEAIAGPKSLGCTVEKVA